MKIKKIEAPHQCLVRGAVRGALPAPLNYDLRPIRQTKNQILPALPPRVSQTVVPLGVPVAVATEAWVVRVLIPIPSVVPGRTPVATIVAATSFGMEWHERGEGERDGEEKLFHLAPPTSRRARRGGERRVRPPTPPPERSRRQ